jgi:hypothetical protein
LPDKNVKSVLDVFSLLLAGSILWTPIRANDIHTEAAQSKIDPVSPSIIFFKKVLHFGTKFFTSFPVK